VGGCFSASLEGSRDNLGFCRAEKAKTGRRLKLFDRAGKKKSGRLSGKVKKKGRQRKSETFPRQGGRGAEVNVVILLLEKYFKETQDVSRGKTGRTQRLRERVREIGRACCRYGARLENS